MSTNPVRSVKTVAAISLLWLSCGGPAGDSVGAGAVSDAPLPYFGEHDVEMKRGAGGELIPDTIYYRIPYFSFVNQDGREVSHRDYEGCIYVADFFFTHCESICPLMTSQMIRLQEMVKRDSLSRYVRFLSHSVDPVRDNPDTLLAYARRIGADLSNWNFVTGNPEDIYWQAETGYMLTAFPSDTAQGGFFHTDKFTLVDRGMHIRGYYDGTSTEDVDRLARDLKKLIADEYPEFRSYP